ncbi:MAG: Glycine betaine-binding periplasmic protein OusX [Paracidovorax wautersii]|uniref:Glycine betaine-binding periplasmic protein OusX n=1 Tax=Paracidovorax wautersii TaxID=1177982 RepID=A0A7V8FQV2_9BURK|nr:MAG: Glycine betaine-binding periplasmic protein OusX [Paracidovorax wautersii]
MTAHTRTAHAPCACPLPHAGTRLLAALALTAATALASATAFAQNPAASPDQPGAGVRVTPVQNTIAEETFQTLLVSRALTKLGYDVQPIQEIEPSAQHLAVANGDATFMADHWTPLQDDLYKNAGGPARFYREGVYSPGALQGYAIDRKTAERYGITNLAQLKDPQIARLFDSNGDGRADLTGCNPGWFCAEVVRHHLKAYGLEGTVEQRQGSYAALIADTINRFQQGEPILYYAWTPYWVSSVLKPGVDVVWLEVPFSAMPGAQQGTDTRLPNGKNYGFTANNQHILANKAFAQANPAAARLFAVMRIPAADINAQNLRMRNGESSQRDIERHVDLWIQAHPKTFDGWLQSAREAAR